MDAGDILEDKDSGPDVQISFPTSVTSRIEELMGGIDQFDSAEFDPVTYINRVFPTEQSLAGVESAAARCEYHLAAVDADIRRLVRAQAQQRNEGQKALLEAQRCIGELALQVADINVKAERSETMVREITSEIKQLDIAKSNLTGAITALNHYHMLAGGLTSLQQMTSNRQYKELVLPLQAIMEVLQHFECYRDIPEISSLRDQVQAIRSTLASQILADCKEFFTSRSSVPPKTIAEACAVVDTLDAKVKQELLKWFIGVQLQEYTVLFSAEQECAWLSGVERRYAWLKKHLLSFEETRAHLFPLHWRLSERTAHTFCKITHSELAKIMASRRAELDVKLLLHAVQKTYHFECLLHKRFIGTEIGENVELRPPDNQGDFDLDVKETEGQSQAQGSPWLGLIGSCFEPYLSLYITSLDANLRALMDRFVQEARSAEGGGGGGGAAGGVGGGGAVLASCADLFLFYKRCLVQCARLTTGEPMLELAGVFQKYLREYAASVLGGALPRGGGGAAPSLVANLHTLLRDDGNTARYTKQEVSKITSVITTAEYCLETSVHLELKLKEKVSPSLAHRVDLLPEQHVFHKIIDDCIQLLVQDLELACSPALTAMTRVPWAQYDTVGDQSAHVTQLLATLHDAVPALRDSLHTSRKYFTQFCIRFANSFIPKLISHIYKCKPLSTAAAEQLLLDTHTLKTALLGLPSAGGVPRPAPAPYTKVVIKLMTKAEMILKLVMAPLEGNAESFVAQFASLVPECSLAELHRALEMKGARLTRAQRDELDDMFKRAARPAT